MMGTFLNYQKLLAYSLKTGETYDDSNHPFAKFLFIIFSFFLLVLIKGTGQFIIFLLGLPLIYIYYIINSPDKLYEIPPVTKKYTIINIYLYVLLTIVFFYIFCFGVNMTALLVSGEKYLFFDFISGWKSVLVSLLLCLFLSCIYIPGFFIKELWVRRVLIILETILFKILLIISNDNLGNKNELTFLKKNSILGNYMVLIILMGFLIIIAALSMRISYRLYRGKEISC